MFTIVQFYILDLITFAITTPEDVAKNPLWYWFLLVVIITIAILGVRVYIIDKRKENRAQRRA